MRARARRRRDRRGLARAPGIAARRDRRPGGGGRRVGCHRLRQPRAVRAPRPHAALLRGPDRCRRRPRGDRGGRPGSPHQRTRHRAVARRGRGGAAGNRRHRAPGPPPERRVPHAGAVGAPARHLQGRRQHRLPRGRSRRRAALDLFVAEPGAGARVAGAIGRRCGRHRHRACRRSEADRTRLPAAGGAPAAAGRVRPCGPATGRLGAGAERRRRPGGRGVPSGRARDRRTRRGRGRGDRGKRLRPGAGRAGPPTRGDGAAGGRPHPRRGTAAGRAWSTGWRCSWRRCCWVPGRMRWRAGPPCGWARGSSS